MSRCEMGGVCIMGNRYTLPNQINGRLSTQPLTPHSWSSTHGQTEVGDDSCRTIGRRVLAPPASSGAQGRCFSALVHLYRANSPLHVLEFTLQDFAQPCQTTGQLP
eukprot:4258950-Amphidinium_carterae.1